jgi:ubiquinol-cytochrome c reductase cytochrome c1 subunit
MKKIFVAFFLLLLPAAAMAQEDMVLDKAPVRTDPIQLQAGARTFVNYCLNCHGASAVRYNQLEKLGLTEADIKDNLLFTGDKVGDMMTVALKPTDAKQWFGTTPPDLSVIARSRGADWLYTYLRTFYRDPSRPTGWNNLAFANVGMPNVLWSLSGENKLTEKEFAKDHEADAAQRAVRSFSLIEEKGSGTESDPTKYTLRYVEADKPGAQTPADFDVTVANLVAFLVYIGEPHAAERKEIGYGVLFGLFVLILLTYFLKRNFWSDIH